ncbi:hypothetical protein L596_012498 [Steinernema carpocapsae]|uniref:7TM GPCR serpentine receptor class x (Srx) domain-containing protein n=1 Tax=Steinernema carpocapsae TaxID=34508 RepID=A0A4U5NXC8_STECR|nr:hypothetical protein L596_012498 [Steinernema carpocapsae]
MHNWNMGLWCHDRLDAVYTTPYSASCQCTVQTAYFDFQFKLNLCGLILGLYADFMFTVAVIVLVAVLEICTFIKVKKYYKTKILGNDKDSKQSKYNVKFFYQSACQGLAVVFEISVYFCVAPGIHEKWTHLFCSSVLFIGVNVLDAIIVTSFNKDIRRRFYTWNKETFHSTSDATPGTNNTNKAASTRQQTIVNK